MDIYVRSNRAPEYSAKLSESAQRVGTKDSSEEQNQTQPQATPTQSAVRFTIRSSKERQQSLSKASTLKYEPFEKASRNIKESREEMSRVYTVSPSSPDTGPIETRRPRALSQLSLSIGSEMCINTQMNPDCVESPTSNGRGRTEWKQAYLSNRSKSLDWRGSKSDGGNKNETDVMRNTKDIAGRSMRRSESLERSGAPSRPNPNEVARPLKKVSLQIQPFNMCGQRSNSNGLISSAGTGTPPVRMVALAQSFPSRLKANHNQDKTEERRNPWHTEHSGTKTVQEDHLLKSQVTTSKVNEITGNQTVLGRSAGNVLEDNSKSGFAVPQGIITPALFKRRSLENRPSFSSSGKVKTVSYNPEACEASFPKTLFKKGQMNYATLSDTVSSNGKDNLVPMSAWSQEKPLSQDSQSSATKNSLYDERNLTRHIIGLGTQSLGRARNRYFTTPISYSAYAPNNSDNIQKIIRKETEKQVEISTVQESKGMVTIPGKQPQSSPEGGSPHTKPQSPQSTAADSEKHHRGVGLEFGSSGNPSKTCKALLEQVQGLGTQSLGRTKSRHFTTPISYSAYALNSSDNTQKSTRKETEKQAEITTNNLQPTKGMGTIPGNQPQSSPEEGGPQTKPQSPQSTAADSEKHHHGVDLECGSSGNPIKKIEASLEKVQEPSFAFVRNTIHKFEALAMQNQKTSSRIQHHRRAFSVTEKPKVALVNKTYSDRSLGKRWGNWNRESLSENLFTKCEDSDEAVGKNEIGGPVQITTQDKEPTMKTQSKENKPQEPGVVQTLTLLDEVSSDQRNEAKLTITKTKTDEPDSSILNFSNLTPYQNLKNNELSDEKVRNYLSSTMSLNSQKSSGVTDVSHSDLQDSTKNKYLKSTKDKPFLTPETTSVLSDPDKYNPVKSTLLTGKSDDSKSPSNLLSVSGEISPIHVFPSASGETNNPFNSIKDEKVAAKVIRWIMDKGVDDENDEDCDDYEDDEGTECGYDSDSGESSVTITSNMSTRSFSMSLVELRSLGGLDLPPSDGNGSNDDENWMSKRTVSISSDVSALSSVTLLGMDELDCLLNDVKALDDDAFENYEDVHVTVLHKEAGSGLGFTVAGGVDQNKPVTVHKVLRNGIAAQEGSIHVGDQVLSINGTALHNSTHNEVTYNMRKARGRTMAVVVIRRGEITETCSSIKDSPQKAAGSSGSRLRLTLNKSRSDLGFSLEGGVGSSLGDMPLTVQRLFQGGPVGKVFPGDELLEVEGQRLEGLRRLEVWHLIKRLPPGPVEVLLHRPRQ